MFIMLFTAIFWLLSIVTLPTAHALPNPLLDLTRHLSSAEIAAFLSGHNVARKAHGAPDLVWSPELAAKAQNWSDKCRFEGTKGTLSNTQYGELQVAATSSFPIRSAVDEFLKDGSDYDKKNPTLNHWTQIVWKSTKHVGCAVSQCKDLLGRRTGLATRYLCLYDPPGNVLGEALFNVQV